MSAPGESGLLAIDVGNSQVKLGWYPPEVACTSDSKLSELPIAAPQLVQPEEMIACTHVGMSGDEFLAQAGGWLDQLPAQDWCCYIGSVHAGAAAWMNELLSMRAAIKVHTLTAADLPIEVRVDEPEKVGIDRLLSAVAANRLRMRGCPAVVVSLGTACTVNLIAADGAFEGGAIFPGIGMSAAALQSGTSLLPLVCSEAIEPPDNGVGKSTKAAISSGLIWGVVGAVQELARRMTQDFDQPAQLMLTGGDAPQLAAKLAGDEAPVVHIPNMVLAGIHIAAGEIR